MNELQQVAPKNLDDLLNHAVDFTHNQISYVSNIRFTVTNNDVVLDLYYIGPDPTDSRMPIAQRLHRVIVPLGLAKNIGELLTEAMRKWEADYGVILPIGQDMSGLGDETSER